MNRYLLKSVCLLGLLAGALSCSVDEDMSDCDFTAKVRVVHHDRDVSFSDCETVTLYVFDKEGAMLEEREVRVGELTELGYPYHGELQFYALGNAQDGVNEKLNNGAAGKPEERGIDLIEKPRMRMTLADIQHTFYAHPSDLFLGSENAPNTRKKRDEITEVPIYRVVGSARITIRSIKEYLQAETDDFSVIILPRYNTVSFRRQPAGGIIAMAPQGSFVEADEYVVPAFNFLSSTGGEEVEVRVYYQGELVETVTHDRYGDPLVAYNGKLLDILIDYGAYVSVTITINPWGVENIWKDFE